MTKVLKVSFPQKCIGCELCVAEIQRQLSKVGLEGSMIRVFKSKHSYSILGELSFTISLDPKINNYNIEKITKSCPTGVFTIEDTATSDNEEKSLLE